MVATVSLIAEPTTDDNTVDGADECAAWDSGMEPMFVPGGDPSRSDLRDDVGTGLTHVYQTKTYDLHDEVIVRANPFRLGGFYRYFRWQRNF